MTATIVREENLPHVVGARDLRAEGALTGCGAGDEQPGGEALDESEARAAVEEEGDRGRDDMEKDDPGNEGVVMTGG